MADLPSPLIDILSAESFGEEHLPGAVNICVYEGAFIDKVRAAFPDISVQLSVYGLNDSTLEAGVAVKKLAAAGYRQVQVLPGGLEAWKLSGGEIERGVAVDPASGRYEVDTTMSVVEWMGRNLFNRHLGTVELSSGHIVMDDGKLVGGCLSIDMTTLHCADIPDPALNAHLIAHLKSDDFFSVDNYPRAEFVISASMPQSGVRADEPNYRIRGDFTLRGTTKPIDFSAVVAKEADGGFTAQAVLELDRTLWGAIYGSARFFGRLGQHLVNDLVRLHLKVVTKDRPTV
jgi:polyisoprenoid-binding protein YceI